MAWIQGTATNYQTSADALLAACVGTSLQTATVSAGGTGYVVGNVLTLTGGTFTNQAQVEVVTIGGGGAVTAVRIANAGTYITAPSSPTSTTGGAGTGCTVTTTWGTNGWQIRRAVGVPGSAQSAAVSTAGTGYAVNDVLTLSGGSAFQTAQFRVSAVGGGGAVSAVTLERHGLYATVPTNPASVTGGGGTGCQLTVTYGSGQREIIVEGIGSGSDQIFVGWRTYLESGSGATSWELAAFTGYNSGVSWADQSGISPGRWDVANTGGSFVPGSVSSTNHWFSVRPRRINGVVRPGTNYFSFGLGLLNPFATTGEWPYPVFVSSGVSDRSRLSSASDQQIGSVCSPWSGFGGSSGNVRDAGGVWRSVANASFPGGNRSRLSGQGVYPGNYDDASFTDPADSWIPGSSLAWGVSGEDVFSQSSSQSGRRVLRTPNTAGDLVLLFPATAFRAATGSDRALYGEMDGIFAIDGQGGVVSENYVLSGTRRLRVFQSGNLTDAWRHVAVEEI